MVAHEVKDARAFRAASGCPAHRRSGALSRHWSVNRCLNNSQQQQLHAQLQQLTRAQQHLQQHEISNVPEQPTLSLEGSTGLSTCRRHLLAAVAVAAAAGPLAFSSCLPPAALAEDSSLIVTDRIYLDVGVASSAFKPAGERTLGDKTVLPANAEPAGRIVIGLYGNLAPVTVANILAAVKAGSYTGSAFSRISPGEYIQLGRQGNRRMGDIDPPLGLPVNSDLTIPGPFKQSHSRPGTVALSLSENDEDPAMKDNPDYRNLQFYITTGPGPVPRLDGVNPVFGRVLSGMDTVIRLSQVPSFQPDIRSQQLNRFAAFLGDDRADNVRRQYGKPLKAIVILNSGVLPADAAGQEGALALKAGSIVDIP